MFICRLFHRDRPFEQIDARIVAAGSISIGRDPSADWMLDDPEGTLSRVHCRLDVADGRLMLNDCSTNGTYLGSGERAPTGEPVLLAVRDTIRMGGLTILVDAPDHAENADDLDRTALHLPLTVQPPHLPADWAEVTQAEAVEGHRDMPLLDAFCKGARLDVSALASEDAVEVMERLGAIYQQTVLGLATLVQARAQTKAHYQLDRTRIGAVDNNPFKWAAPRRLAHELLCARDDGFLGEAEAVRASFTDIGNHLAGIAAGADAAIAAVLAALDPAAIDREAAARGFSLKGKAGVARDVHGAVHAALARHPNDDLLRAFSDAYQAAAVDPDDAGGQT